MPNIERFSDKTTIDITPHNRKHARAINTTNAVIESVANRMMVRAAKVQAEALVTEVKMRELDHLVQSAMTGQAMLRQWAATIGRNDPLLADELETLMSYALAGKAQIIKDYIDAAREL